MNTKDFFGMLLMVFLAVAGLTACSDNDNDNLTNIAETEWYGSHVVSTATNEGVEETHTAILGFIFSEDGTSCTVETGIETLMSVNRVTKYVSYFSIDTFRNFNRIAQFVHNRILRRD